MDSRKKLIFSSLLVAATLGFFFANYAQGQSILDGKLTGTITDETGEPLPGVTVEVTSPALITGKRSTITSDKGTYVFLHLPVGIYELKASLTGFKTTVQRGIHISAGSVRVVDLKMPLGAIEEEITVTAVAPVVDAKTSAISTNIETDLLNKLPTSRDAFYDLSLTTPGMVSQGKDGTWLPSPNAYGSTSNENIFLVNGVNTTNPRAAAYGSLVQVNYNAVEEVRLIALGSKAEYGNFTGVAIDVLTKSGSNEFHGNAALYTILGEGADNQPDSPVAGRAVDMGGLGKLGERLFIGVGDDILRYAKQEYEGNFTIGGPIVRDKIWFYGGFDYVKSESKEPFWNVMNRYWGRFGDIKFTAEPWSNQRAWVAYHYENNDGDGWTWNPHWDDTMTYGQAAETHTVSSQWQWLASGKTVFTAKYLGFWRDDKPHIPDDAPDHPGYINWWKWNVYGINGAFPYVEAQKSSRNTIQADVSHYAEDFLGEHDIKFGVQYTTGRGNWMGGYFHNYANFAYPMRWTQNINYMRNWYGDTGVGFYNRQTWLNPFLTVRTNDQLGFFIDDQWSPTKRLTLNLGLRFDRMTAKYGIGKVYELASTPEDINTPPAVIRDRADTDNIFDFKTWAPRIGITYALTSDMKTVFRANYGRYYLPLSAEYLRRFGPNMPDTTQHYIFYSVPFNLVDLNGNDYVDPEEVTVGARYLYGDTYLAPGLRPSWQPEWQTVDYSWQLNVQEGLKDQYTDQITLNIEREILSDLSLSATYIYKRTANIFVNWPLNEETQEPFEYGRVSYTTQYGETVSLYDIVLEDYNGDTLLDNQDVSWIGNNLDYEVRNMPEIDGHKPRRIFQGLQFVLKKRFSNRWQMLSSLLISTTKGMAARSIRQDFNFEGPMVMDTLWLAGLNQTMNTMEGPLPHTQKFELKVSGSYRIPGVEADLGFRFRANSGRPLWPLEVIPVWPSWSATRPAGSVINTGDNYIVSINPEEPWYLPSEKVLDLRLDKSFKIANFGLVYVSLDALNVFNEHAVVNAGYGGAHEPLIGRVSGLTFPSRKLRLSLRFEF